MSLAGLVTLALFFAKDLHKVVSRRGRLQILLGTLAVAVVGACALLVADYRFVRTIEIASLDKTVTVTVGYERTSFAKSNFPQASDWELLRQRSSSEEEIRGLWTGTSIIIGRLILLASYMLFLLPATATACFGVLFDILGPPTAD